MVILDTPAPNPLPPADLLVLGGVTEAPAGVGGFVGYRVTVTNAGPASASGVRFRDVLPVGADFLEATVSAGRWQRTGRVVETDPLDLPPGAGFAFDVRLVARSNERLVNAAIALAANPDPNPANNRSRSATATGFSRCLSLAGTDLVFDAVGQRVLAGVSTTGGALSNSIVALDPLDGTLTPLLRLEGEPAAIAVSDNSPYLFAALTGTREVHRVDLTGPQVDLRLSLDSRTPPPERSGKRPARSLRRSAPYRCGPQRQWP